MPSSTSLPGPPRGDRRHRRPARVGVRPVRVRLVRPGSRRRTVPQLPRQRLDDQRRARMHRMGRHRPVRCPGAAVRGRVALRRARPRHGRPPRWRTRMLQAALTKRRCARMARFRAPPRHQEISPLLPRRTVLRRHRPPVPRRLHPGGNPGPPPTRAASAGDGPTSRSTSALRAGRPAWWSSTSTHPSLATPRRRNGTCPASATGPTCSQCSATALGNPTRPTRGPCAPPAAERTFYFTALVDGPELRNTQGTAGGLGWLVDTRAGGGYVVGGGSVVDRHPDTVTCDTPPTPLPGWLARRRKPSRTRPWPRHSASKSTKRRTRRISEIPEQERENTRSDYLQHSVSRSPCQVPWN